MSDENVIEEGTPLSLLLKYAEKNASDEIGGLLKALLLEGFPDLKIAPKKPEKEKK